MPLVPAKIVVVARIHADGSSASDNKAITVDWGEGSPLNHPTVPLFDSRGSFGDVEETITVNAAASVPTPGETYRAAETQVKKRVAGIFGLDSNNVFAAAHAWRDGRWIPVTAAAEFGHGFLLTLNGTTYREPVRWGPQHAPILLTLDFVVAIFSP